MTQVQNTTIPSEQQVAALLHLAPQVEPTPELASELKALSDTLHYLPADQFQRVDKAVRMASDFHHGQVRHSGDPYVIHPIRIARYLAEMRLDVDTVVTALLHDAVEDTSCTDDDIEAAFGPEVRRLVDGVTKLSSLPNVKTTFNRQAENIRKLFMAITDDIRVLLVKLGDRLDNVRTLHFHPKPEKRARIAAETMEIYVPLAERIGMRLLKEELEDRCFAVLLPDERESIITRLQFLRGEGQTLVDKVLSDLRQLLADNGVEGTVSGRLKTYYSIYQKMQKKDVAFEQLSDIVAFRCLVGSVADCYHGLGLVHNEYTAVAGRFKDYISSPKPNGYRSLHTGVMGPRGNRLEIQFRTHAMHEWAERGLAAHWAYKAQEGIDPTEVGASQSLMEDLRDILDNAETSEEVVEHTKLDLFQDQVFCFSPKGDLIRLPKGANAIDFAYAVHSAVGNRCVGAKINNSIRNLRTPLRNGDQVEILTSKNAHPNPEWENIALTSKAKAAIRRYRRQMERDEYIRLGRRLLDRHLESEKLQASERALGKAADKLGSGSSDDLLVSIGAGLVNTRQVLTTMFPALKQQTAPPKSEGPLKSVERAQHKKTDGGNSLEINGLIKGMAVHYARCCHPLPGEQIVGLVTTGKGVTIHRLDCETLENFQDQPERWLDVSWASDDDRGGHIGRVQVFMHNTPGALGNVTTLIGRSEGAITDIRVVSRSQDYFELLVDIEVSDVVTFNQIITSLRSSQDVDSVERARN